ncbi:MAG: hypothetical protein ACI8UO_001418 [Verrucomicrobiales bacterium]|jgi:hypothetical protein
MHATRKIPKSPVLVILFLCIATGFACQVPVFRFALERWEADAYMVVISPAAADGKLSAEEQSVVDFLEASQVDAARAANIMVRVDDQATAEDAGKIRLFYPNRIRGVEVAPIWTGDATKANAEKIVDSPARREIVKRILDGHSSTWLLLRSGSPEKDETAMKELAEFSEEAKKSLKIPEGVVTQEVALEGDFTGNPDNILRSEVPLKIEFSAMAIDRTDPAEEVFIQMLVNLEDDLNEYEKEPMVFPVFGRGRVLEPLIGLGINRDNALDYSTYLCGACSCEVKDQNPGMDLVIGANWDEALEGNTVVIDKILPPLTGTAALIAAVQPGEAAENTASIEVGVTPEPEIEEVKVAAVVAATPPLPSAEHKGSASKGPLLKPHFPKGESADSGESENTEPVVADSASKMFSGPYMILGGSIGAALLAIGVGTMLLKRRVS